jgi:RND family efflux transporter MFP subunit
MMRKYIYGLVCVVFILVFLGQSCQTKETKAQRVIKTPVRLAPVVRKEIARKLFTYGRLSTKGEMKLSFKIGGIIERIFADEGQRVKKGQLLARLDLSEINAQVRQAQSAYEKAKRDKDRIERLYEEKAATLEQFQNVQTAFQVAQSQLSAAEFNLRYSEIHAPSRGRILKRLMEENELVGTGTPVFFFASTEKDWVVRVGVSDRDLVRLRLNDPATVTFDAYPGETLQARVSEIVESADPKTGTYEIELKIDSGDKRLVSGFVAKVDIFPSTKRPHFIIPVDALVEAEGDKGYVYTVDKETMTAKRIPIAIGFLVGDKVAVESGLEDTAEVVTEGAPYLLDGKEVEIIQRENFEE